jgi:hypothetical protein
MGIHHHSKVNALINPVTSNDVVLAESGEKYLVCQNIAGHYWLKHLASGNDLTHPISGQIGIVRQIADLVNI